MYMQEPEDMHTSIDNTVLEKGLDTSVRRSSCLLNTGEINFLVMQSINLCVHVVYTNSPHKKRFQSLF